MQTNVTDAAAGNREPLSLRERVRSLRLPDRVHQPRARFAWVPWFLCLVLACTTGYFAWLSLIAARETGDPSGGQQSDPAGPDDPAPVLVGRAAPKPKGGEIVLESKGYIIPLHQIQVSPKVGGMVIELRIEEGMQVKEGDILAKLETTEYQAEYDRVAAIVQAARHRLSELKDYRGDEVRQARAELDDAVAQREQLFQEWRRNQSLRAGNLVSPKEYEQAESAFKSQVQRAKRLQIALDLLEKGPRDERIAAAKSDVQQYEAELVRAKWKLDNCTVVAPVSGTILSKKAEKGNMVNPSAFSNGLSASLCEMADLSDMEVDLAIAERDIGKLFKGQKCVVRAEAFAERSYSGVVSRLMPTADRSKGAVPVRVKIAIPRDEEGKYLRPEMGAVVTFFHTK
jgi:HlyD family secretion protein